MIEVLSSMNLVKTSYKQDDVKVLLKDLTDKMVAIPTARREQMIQSGVHYSEMLPEEKAPTEQYMKLYNKALDRSEYDIALGIAVISEMVMNKTWNNGGDVPVLISLARAGIPVGILMKRYIMERYNILCPHYAISIIRGKGIDKNAMEFIYSNEVVGGGHTVKDFVFVDGWTGKGMIASQLMDAVLQLRLDDKWYDLSSDLVVLADPGNVTKYSGTKHDFLLPSACLNSTISGLLSRTILNSHINTKEGDFHGAVYFEQFENIDQSNRFLDAVSRHFSEIDSVDYTLRELGVSGMSVVQDVCNYFGIPDYTKVKPGIGETTRVLLRRVPWKVLINVDVDIDKDKDIQHILELCRQKTVPIERYNLGNNYKVCGIIKELSADA